MTVVLDLKKPEASESPSNSTQFLQPLTMDQRALILVATSQHQPINTDKKKRGIVKNRLRNNMSKSYVKEERFRMEETLTTGTMSRNPYSKFH